MAPLATLLVFIGIFGLFWFDRQNRWSSNANLVPFFWLLIAMSRPVTAWMVRPTDATERAESYMEGSPIDRTILIVLIACAMVTLWRRKEATAAILRRNAPIILFLLYCLISVFWAEFPVVSFKRWIRAVGDVMMILVVLTDSHPEIALKAIISRVGYFLVPLSILFIRFFPDLGRAYSVGGRPMWTGVCTDKNALGALCMVVGTVVLWRLLERRVSQGGERRRAGLIALVALFLMVLYIVPLVDSKTAQMCFLFATVVVVFRWLFKRPWAIFGFTVGTVAACYAVLILGVGGGDALQAIGREASLTGRTDVWDQVLRFFYNPPSPLTPLNPWWGAGYESFWVGERLYRLRGFGGNQAHNGYLEIFVNLGWMGVIFLGLLILTGYRSMIASCRINPDLGRLKVAFFVICLTYNFSEAAFKMMSPVWLLFLWATLSTPAPQTVAVEDPERRSVPQRRPSPRLVTSPFAPSIRVKSV